MLHEGYAPLEEMYPHSRDAGQYYLQDIEFGEKPQG